MIQFLLTSDAMRFIFEILIIRQLVLNINLYLKVFSNGLFPGLVFFMHRAKVFSLFRDSATIRSLLSTNIACSPFAGPQFCNWMNPLHALKNIW